MTELVLDASAGVDLLLDTAVGRKLVASPGLTVPTIHTGRS